MGQTLSDWNSTNSDAMMLVAVLGDGLTEMRTGWIECVIIHGLIKGVPT